MAALSRGVRVTCEVTPHHFVLTDEMLASPVPYDTNVKMNPPLREAVDRDAIVQGLADGSVDAIATETAVSLCFDRLVHPGILAVTRLVELLSVNPARILRVPGGSLSEGAPADISILAPDLDVTVSAARMRSRSKNTPFDGWRLRGGVGATIVGGRTIYVNQEFQELRF